MNHVGALPATWRRSLDRPGRRVVVRRWLAVLGVLVGGYLFFVVEPSIVSLFGFDARSYWGFPRADLYAGTESANGIAVYRYSPLFVPLLELLSRLDWGAFTWLWTGGLFVTYLWLAGRWWAIGLLFPPIAFELYMGNIHLLLAAAIVLGFRHPAAWSFVLLTKVTPGIGLLWFALRREWRALGIALGATAVIIAAGLVIAPAAWWAWFHSLTITPEAEGPNHVPVPLPVRLAVAVALVTWGALRDHRWTVMVAATLALPTIWTHGLAMLIGVIPLVDRRWGTDGPMPALRRWIAGFVRRERARPAVSVA